MSTPGRQETLLSMPLGSSRSFVGVPEVATPFKKAQAVPVGVVRPAQGLAVFILVYCPLADCAVTGSEVHGITDVVTNLLGDAIEPRRLM